VITMRFVAEIKKPRSPTCINFSKIILALILKNCPVWICTLQVMGARFPPGSWFHD